MTRIRFVESLGVLVVVALSSVAAIADENASIETRRAVAESIRGDLARELEGKVFSGSVTRRVGEEIAGLRFSAALTATATGSFSEPARNLRVEISRLSQPDTKTIRIQVSVLCPFHGKARAASSLGSASSKFTAHVTVSIDVEVSLSFDARGELTALARIHSASGRMNQVRLEQKIADRLLSDPMEAAINRWMGDNPQPFIDATRIAVERGVRQMNAEFRKQTDTLLTLLRTSGLTASQEQQLRQVIANLTPAQREQLLALSLQSGVTLENLTAQQNEILKSLTAEQKKQLDELLKALPQSGLGAANADPTRVIQSVGALLNETPAAGAGPRTPEAASSVPQINLTPEQKKATELILKKVMKKL